MNLFKAKTFYIVTDGKYRTASMARKFATNHRVRRTNVDVQKYEDSYMIRFTTRLGRTSLSKKLSKLFGNTYEIRMGEMVALVSKET